MYYYIVQPTAISYHLFQQSPKHKIRKDNIKQIHCKHFSFLAHTTVLPIQNVWANYILQTYFYG